MDWLFHGDARHRRFPHLAGEGVTAEVPGRNGGGAVASMKCSKLCAFTENPGGTGKPARIISPRFAAFPPTCARSSRPTSCRGATYRFMARACPEVHSGS